MHGVGSLAHQNPVSKRQPEPATRYGEFVCAARSHLKLNRLGAEQQPRQYSQKRHASAYKILPPMWPCLCCGRSDFRGAAECGGRDSLVRRCIVRGRQFRWFGDVGAVLQAHLQRHRTRLFANDDSRAKKLEFVPRLQALGRLQHFAVNIERRLAAKWLNKRFAIQIVHSGDRRIARPGQANFAIVASADS